MSQRRNLTALRTLRVAEGLSELEWERRSGFSRNLLRRAQTPKGVLGLQLWRLAELANSLGQPIRVTIGDERLL